MWGPSGGSRVLAEVEGVGTHKSGWTGMFGRWGVVEDSRTSLMQVWRSRKFKKDRFPSRLFSA